MSFLDYNAFTGKFVWNVDRGGKAKTGEEAGCIRPDRYRQMMIDGNFYYVHRLAWLICKNEMPTFQIDHINLDKTDYRLSNLRLATASENSRNQAKREGLTSKYISVRWFEKSSKWRADIRIDRKKKYLGYFDNEDDAATAYDLAAIKNHLEFARLNFTYTLTDDNKVDRYTDY